MAAGGWRGQEAGTLAALLGYVAGAASGHRGAKYWDPLAKLVDSAPADPSAAGPAEGPGLLTTLRQAPEDEATALRLAKWLLDTADADARFRTDFMRWRRGLAMLEEFVNTLSSPANPAQPRAAGPEPIATPTPTPVSITSPAAPAGSAPSAGLPTWARWLVVCGVTAVAFLLTTFVADDVLLPSLLKESTDRLTVASSLGVAVAAVSAAWGPVFADLRRRQEEPGAPASIGDDDGPNGAQPGGIDLRNVRRSNQVVISGRGNTVTVGLQNRAVIAIVVLALAVALAATLVGLRLAPASGDHNNPPPGGETTTTGVLKATTVVGGQNSHGHFYWPGTEGVLGGDLSAGHALTAEPGIAQLANSVTITLQTRSSEALLINGVQVVNLHRLADPRTGLFVDVPCEGCGGQGNTRHFSTRLDDRTPQIVESKADGTGHYYYVTAGSPEEFQIDVDDRHCDCTFDLEIDWVGEGTDRTTLLDNGGRHFHSMGADDLPWYRDYSPGGAASVLVPQPAPTPTLGAS